MIHLVETATRIIATGELSELKVLRKAFRYRPASYWRSAAYQLYKITEGEKGWDGYRYPFKLEDGRGEILRGHKDGLLAICRKERIQVGTDKLNVSPFADVTARDITPDLIQADFELDDKQREAVVQWLRHGIGVANMDVNAGKTATFAAAAAFIKRKYPEARFLYFTPAQSLVTQVYDRMREFLPDWDITQYGGGKQDRDGKDMVVATQAILTRNYKELMNRDWFTSFHVLLMDESHHCQSPTAEQIILSCASYFRFGASATTKEDDPEKWSNIVGLCGPVRVVVGSSELIEAGRSAAPHLYLVDVPDWKGKFRDFDSDPEEKSPAWTLIDGEWVKATYLGPVPIMDEKTGKPKMKLRSVLVDDKWVKRLEPVTKKTVHLLSVNGQEYEAPASYTLLNRRYDKAIMRFRERNELIVKWTKYYSDKGWPTVVVATRTPHVLILDSLLSKVLGDKVRPLIGESTPAQRRDTFAWFKKTPGAVLISSIIKEGISINEIKAGVVADPVADWELAKQIIGRFMREKPENTCYITWFIDHQHPRYLRNVRTLMERLEKIEGFTFYHPVAGPETIGQALVHKGHAT